MINSSDKEKEYGIKEIYRLHAKISKDKFTKNSEFLKNLDSLNLTIVKCEFTKDNLFMLLSDGKVVSKGKEKLLGREENSNISKKYGHVIFETDDSNVMIYNISAGDEHVLALDQNYNLWGWGDNSCYQVHPLLQKKYIEKPIQIRLPNNVQPVQIFALQRSSMVICRNNLIYMWGSLNEKFLTDYKSEGNFAKEFILMKNLTAFVINEINKNDDDVSDIFINSRKLFNVKYNQTLKENSDKSNGINKIKLQIENLKSDLESRKSQMMDTSTQNFHADSSDKRINILNDLLKSYEEKLNKISSKKENLRIQLIHIEEDLTQKDIDIKALTEQIDSVEDKLENYNNELTQLRENSREDQTATIGEKNIVMSNLKIYRESLMTNMQVIIELLEGKEKKRKSIADQIHSQTKKEDSYLKARYTVEDMISVLFQSFKTNQKDVKEKKTTYTNLVKKDPNLIIEEKIKEIFLELYEINKNLDKLHFIELSHLYPFKNVEELLKISNSDIGSIKTEILNAESTLTEVSRNNLNIVFEIIQNKIELILEQNFMIKTLYKILSNLENEIHQKILKDSQIKIGNYSILDYLIKNLNKSIPDMETIYKELILNYLKDAYNSEKDIIAKYTQEELETIDKDKKNYLRGKKEIADVLEERNQIKLNTNKKINLEEIISFGDGDEETKRNNGCIIF